MLLINELKEYKLINGSIGIAKKMIFEHKDGPNILHMNSLLMQLSNLKKVLLPNERNGELI